jgi:tetratricopeptide (TPR) repeat protein
MAKYALVIGIQKYGGNGFSDLKKPAADAEAIAQILEKCGDFVKVNRSPSRWNPEKNSYEIAETKLDGKTLEKEITEFFEQVGNNEALIYFSGHGYQIEKLGNKKGYLVTSNCTTETVATHGIALDDLNNLILQAELSSLVVLLDCCHAGSLLEKNLIDSSLTVFNSKQNYFFATACRSYEQAYEGEEYSVFTDAVLKALKSPGRVRITQLNYVISKELENQGQEPVFLNKGGDIILVTNPEKEDVTRDYKSDQEITFFKVSQNEFITDILKKYQEQESNQLIGERHKRVDFVKHLMSRNDFAQAIVYLEELKNELWYQADNLLKYRILANIGLARLGLNEIKESAKNFLEAFQYNPDNDKAITYAAMGYFFQEEEEKAKKLVNQALQKNPANALAYSLCIRIAPITESIDSILNIIPSAYHEDTDVLIALGTASLDRKLHEKAIDYWQIAIKQASGKGVDGVKIGLGAALIESLEDDYLLIISGQISDFQKQKIEKAISLFTEVIGDYPNPNNLSSLQFTAIFNRVSARRLIRQYDEAIHDIEIALNMEPNNLYLIKQRVIINCDNGSEELAYQYLQPFLSSLEMPEAHLLAASSLMSLKRFYEADSILDDFLEKTVSSNLKRDAKHLKLDLFLNINEDQKANDLLQELKDEYPEDIFSMIQESFLCIKNKNNEPEKILNVIKKTKEVIISSDSIIAKFRFADLLHSFKFYRDAAEVYEQFVDKNLNSPLSWKLLGSYYFVGYYKQALDMCQKLLEKYGALVDVSEMAVCIYCDKQDLSSALNTCENYLKYYPNDIVMQLRLADIHYAMGEFLKLDQFLDSKPSTQSLNKDACKKLAQLYKARNKAEDFLDLIYEIRLRFYDDIQIHVLYKIGYFEISKLIKDTHIYQIIQDDCGVLIKDNSGDESWFIMEDREDADLAKFQLNSNQPLYQSLIGMSYGDEIIQSETVFGKNTLTIISITDKYFAADQQTLLLLKKQTKVESFEIINIPMDGDQISPDFINQFLELLQDREKSFENMKLNYIDRKIPIGVFSKFFNRNVIELWQSLTSGNTPFIHSWSNFKNELFQASLLTLQQGGLVVIDPISLMTLHYLKVADNIVSILGQLGIAQSTIDLLQEIIDEKKGLQGSGFTIFSTEDGQGVYQEISSENVTQQKIMFEKILDWTRNNCIVLPCHRALDINANKRKELNDLIGAAFIDTVLIAGEPDRILYSDDQWLRWYANIDSGVKGVWTQVILKYCLTQKSSDESLYHRLTLLLAQSGYTYTIIDDETLMETVRLGNKKVSEEFTVALKLLINQNTNQQYLLSLVSNFLYHFYLEGNIVDDIFIDPRDAFVFEILKILTAKSSAITFVYELKQAIERKFNIIPLQRRDVLNAIDSWMVSQSIIT